MVVVPISVDGQTNTLYLDGWLHEKLQKWLRQLKKDDDLVVVVDGKERTGKSVFGMGIAKFLDPNFDLKNICLNPEQFKKAIKEANRGDAIIYDEAFTGLSSKGSLSQINKILVEMMMEMGAKNLKVILILPTFFMLEKYAAIFRAKCLFHIYKRRGQRGFWRYYGSKRKKALYLAGKKFLSYSTPKASRSGKFTNVYTVNEEAYRAKKAAAFQNKDRSSKDDRFKAQRDIIFWYLTRKLGITIETITDMLYVFGFQLDQSNLSKDLRALDEKILTEVENPPDDNYIFGLLHSIQTNNCIERAKKRTLEVEERAKRQLEKEIKRKARLDKQIKQKIKETGKSEEEILADLLKAPKKQGVITPHLEKGGENDAFNDFLDQN